MGFSSDVTFDEEHPNHMMSGDAVQVRFELERLLSDHMAGRIFVWDRELDAFHAGGVSGEPGVVMPPFATTIWPVRPTIEMLTMFTALLCDQALARHVPEGATLEEVLLAETPRTTGILRGADVGEALAYARRAFASVLVAP